MSLRARMVISAVTAAALLVAACGLVVVLVVRAEMVDAADDVAETRAEEVAALARMGALPPRLGEAEEMETAVQVVAGDEVISATVGARDRDFFAGVPLQAPGQDVVVKRETLPVDDEGPFQVTALGTETPSGAATVYVAIDIEDVDDFVGELMKVGGAAVLVLMVTVGFLFWLVVGRTLAPIDEIRRRADAITDHHQLDQRIPEPASQDELGRLTRTINAMLGRLEASALKQEQFVADAAHALRSPLASTWTRLETTLAARGTGPDYEAVLREVLAENLRLSSLADRLLLLARSDASALRLRAVPVDLDDVVREVVAGFRPTSLRLTARIETPAQVSGEPSLLEQVLRNLVENALRHARTSVEVVLTTQSSNAVLMVDDDGPGIPTAERQQAFERFVRLDDARRRDQGGAGLGLAIVGQIVRSHGGTVDVDEAPGGGARFRVLLPLAGDHSHTGVGPPSDGRHQPVQPEPLSGRPRP